MNRPFLSGASKNLKERVELRSVGMNRVVKDLIAQTLQHGEPMWGSRGAVVEEVDCDRLDGLSISSGHPGDAVTPDFLGAVEQKVFEVEFP